MTNDFFKIFLFRVLIFPDKSYLTIIQIKMGYLLKRSEFCCVCFGIRRLFGFAQKIKTHL